MVKMNKMDIENFKKMCKTNNIDMATYDFEAKWDSGLSREENYHKITDDLKKLSPNSANFTIPKDLENYYWAENNQRAKEFRDAELDKELDRIARTQDTNKLNEIYKPIHQALNVLIKGKQNLLVITSNGGLGKSFQVKKYLRNNIGERGEKWTIIKGHISPMEFYHKIYENKDKIILFDDVWKIFFDENIMTMLKSACGDERDVEYRTTSPKLRYPQYCLFDGKIIILLNQVVERNEDLRALISRGTHLDFNLTWTEKMELLGSIAQQTQIGFGRNGQIQATPPQKREALEFIRINTNESDLKLNIRTYLKVLDTLTTLSYWKDYCLKFVLPINPELRLAHELMCSGLKHSAKIEKWRQETGSSQATYYRRVEEFKRLGV